MLCAIVVSIFFGIKLRWFRYRMKMKVPNIEESPVLLRTTTVTEVRENCSIGRYSYIDDNSPGRSSSTTGNYMPQLASSSSFSVKSKNSEYKIYSAVLSSRHIFYTFFLHYHMLSHFSELDIFIKRIFLFHSLSHLYNIFLFC